MKNILITVLITAFLSTSLMAQDEAIEISKDATRLIPVSVTGFSGEVDPVLKFDLEVLGMSIVEPAQAEFQLSGDNNGRVEGRLMQAGNVRFSHAYNAANMRSAAHALADDVVKIVRGTPPIFHGKISFRVEEGSSTEIAVSDFDGHNLMMMTHDGCLVGTPCWEPGERGLLYTSWKSGNTQIIEHNLSSGARRVFAGYPGSNFSPAVSPDGRKVAMILSKNGIPNLYVSDIDGGNLKQLTRTRDQESSPCWSPDGQEICFVGGVRATLHKVSVNGGAAQTIRTIGAFGNATEPDWSPDGKKIAFTCGSGNFSICVVPAGGGDATILVGGEDPCWAPNSRTVIFTRRTGNKRILSLLDVPTKHVKDVRQLSGSCSQPAWAR